MYKYVSCELHSHTLHSDGEFSVSELLKTAKSYGLDGIAITDHNTTSALYYVTDELEKAMLPVIEGIEWTTYFGHLLVIGANKFVDWRFVQKDTIDEDIQKIKDADGAVGIAHPFDVGDPICTGCHWDFNVSNWENVDYIEVWNEMDAINREKNIMAYDYWTDLLNKGHKIAATSGSDWHNFSKANFFEPYAATYLGIEKNAEINTDSIKKALVNGNTFVTTGPFIDLKIKQNNKCFSIGDTIKDKKFNLSLKIDESKRNDVWKKHDIKTNNIVIKNNGKIVYSSNDLNISTEIQLEKGWMIVEIYGTYLSLEETLIGFTSPIYIK